MKFLFAVHNHQPVGNFDFVFEDSYQKSYKPFLDVLENFPNINFSMHFSGPLIDWLEKNHSGYLDRVAKLVDDGRVEIISSGYYEPVLVSIPDSDKIGQIQMMNEYIKSRFGQTPQGLWLTERIWEPSLAKPIVEAGIKFITVDDYHFSTSGKTGKDLNGYFLTEEQGKVLGIFPISQQLRYTIPFEPPKETIKILKKNSKDENSVMVMADDGEKFGVWPQTYELAFGKEKWVKKFCKTLEKNQEWLETMKFSDYFDNHKPLGRIYLQTSSYFEMSEWTLPTELGKKYHKHIEKLQKEEKFEKMKPFLRGGFWRDFLTKYDEANWMLKRTNFVAEKLENELMSSEARQAIWKSQCNCGYWHGVFGGLYLPHIRHANYSNIIEAEVKSGFKKGLERQDLDHDGNQEVSFSTDKLRAFFTPIGGAIRELDILDAKFNIVNTLARYSESYHEKLKLVGKKPTKENASIHDLVLVKEEGLDKHLFQDSHQRWLLQDHFFANDTKMTNVYKNNYKELGDFINGEFSIRGRFSSVILERDGLVNGLPVKLIKTANFKGNSIEFTIEIQNNSEKTLKATYGTEFNFSLLGGTAPDRFYKFDGVQPKNHFLNSKGKTKASEVKLVTEWEKMENTLNFNEKTNVWYYPIETVSMSEAGFERVYQSSVVLPVWKIKLDAGESTKFEFSLTTTVESEKN